MVPPVKRIDAGPFVAVGFDGLPISSKRAIWSPGEPCLESWSLGANGRTPARNVLPLTAEVWGLETAPGGVVYADQVERTTEVVRIARGHAQRLAEAPISRPLTLLPDGRVVTFQMVAGRNRLVV